MKIKEQNCFKLINFAQFLDFFVFNLDRMPNPIDNSCSIKQELPELESFSFSLFPRLNSAKIHRCRKYLDRTFLQYESSPCIPGQLEIFSFYAFLFPLHIFALLSRRNRENGVYKLG